jgi:transposase
VAVFCGIDWAEDHHDTALVDQDGTLLAKRRIGDDAAGFTTLLQLLAEAGDGPDAPIPVAIETSHGLLVAGLRATGRPVFPINPLSVPRYRDRWRGASPTPETRWRWPTPAYRHGRAPSAARRFRTGHGVHSPQRRLAGRASRGAPGRRNAHGAASAAHP